MDVEAAQGKPAQQVARAVATELAAAGIAHAAPDARWLIAARTGVDPHRYPLRLLPAERLPDLAEAVARRVAREPLQLIVGTTSFRGIELACRHGVFIPRPETEVVAGAAIEAALAAPLADAGRGRRRLVDVGTGTGAIACALAVEVPHADIVATDADAAAVDLARTNVARVRAGDAAVPGVADSTTVAVVQGDLLAAVDPAWRGHLDVLVANPPYLPDVDRETWEPEVRDHDPHAALIGGPDGHEVVEALLHLAISWLRPGGSVVVEIDERRSAEAQRAAHTAGLVEVTLLADLAGASRAVVARRPGSLA